jgi:serine phosphatase RsbU (regulator of sigma subunit)/CHASE2 domain-containing sensor protein
VLLVALALFIVLSPTAQGLRHAVFDGYQRAFPLERAASPVTIVLIDENSLARYGQWPWPRTRMAELIERIASHGPLAIGLDLVFPESDRFSPAAIAAELPMIPSGVARVLESLPSNDEVFARAIRDRGVVLGISGESQVDPRFSAPPRAAPVVMSADVLAGLRSYPGHVASLGVIDAAAAGRGIMNSGPQDQVVRVVPLVAQVHGVVVPSLGVETLRTAMDAGLRLSARGGGLLSLKFGDSETVLQEDGNTWLRYSPYTTENVVPAAGVMAGEVHDASIRDHVVLVGVSGLGLQDFKTTPLGEFIPGVHIHAQVIENLYNHVALRRLPIATLLEAGALLLFGLILVFAVPRLSALQGIHLALAMVVVFVGTGLIAFLHFGLLLDPAWPSLGVLAVFGTVVVGTLSEAERQRRQLREQAAHMAGEVDAARRIQMGLLPDPRETLGGDLRFGIAAALEPARTVGGDFYDCFMADERRLFVVVADVAGKGLPAALFMASAKSHIKSAALREPQAGRVLTLAQEEIERENPEQLFVTAFAAFLDVQTGMLEYANAGHEPPFLRSVAGPVERLDPPGGPPLCVIREFVFPTQRRQLRPGDWLFAVTDGATEAMNPAREFFGLQRLRTALSWAAEGVSPQELVRRLQDEVSRFAAGAEAADDITLLALRWEGEDRTQPVHAEDARPA